MTTNISKKSFYIALNITIMSILVFVVFFLAIPGRYSWDFRVNLYFPAQVLLDGASAYDYSLTEMPASVWFPQIIGQFFWLGLFPLEVSADIWLALMVVCFVVSLYFALPTTKPLILFAVFMLIVGIFPPLWFHLHYGQVSLYAMLLLLLTAHNIDKNRLVVIGVLLALASGKPQLIILPVIGILAILLRDHNWRGLIKMALAGIMIGLISLIPLTLANVTWITDYWEIINTVPAYDRPSLLNALLSYMDTQPAMLFFLLVMVGCIVLNIWIWLNLSVKEAMLWSMALNLVAIPLVWTWDYVLLLPLYAYSLFTVKSNVARIWLIAIMIAIIIGFTYVRISGSTDFADDWWMPILMLIGTFIAIRIDSVLAVKINLEN